MTKISSLGFKLVAAVAVMAQLVFVSSASALRYYSVQSDNNGAETLKIKDGSTSAQWTPVAHDDNGLIGASTTNNRVSYIDSDGNLWVKEGPLNAGWTKVADNTLEGGVIGNEIFAVNTDLQLRVKVGPLNAGWTTLQDNVSEFTVSTSGNRIAALNDYDGTNSKLQVKEGGLNAPWTPVATVNSNYQGNFNFPSIAVSDSRIAYFDGNYSNFNVKEGPLNSVWNTNVFTSEGFNVALDGNRLCVNFVPASNQNDTDILCKDGALNSQWALVHDSAYLDDMRTDQITVSTERATSVYPSDSLLLLSGPLTHNNGYVKLDDGTFLGINN